MKILTLTAKFLLVNIMLFGNKGAPKAIPTMCVLTIKKDEQLLPLQAKSRIVALGNLEERFWSKSDPFAPVLVKINFGFLPALLLRNTTHSARVIVKTHSAMEFSHLKKPLLFALPLGIPMLNHTNTGIY